MYKIPVKLEGIERRKRSTGLLHIVAGFFLVISAGTYSQQVAYADFLLMLPVYIVAVVSLLYGFFRKKIDPLATYNHWIRMIQFLTFAVLAISLINLVSTVRIASLAIWAIAILFLMFTERKIFHDTDLQIKEEGVFVPGYFKNHIIPWQVMEGFVLRADFLTITRTNKKYVQLELIKDMEPDEIEEINAYCNQRLCLKPAVAGS